MNAMSGGFVDTVDDFGRQWENYTENTGYYASTDALLSLVGPLLTPLDIRGKTVADVGAGTGRYSRMLHELGAAEILALEPSSAFEVLKHNTADCPGIRYFRGTAEEIPSDGFDLVFCIGVLQFIPEPSSALRAMRRALKPDGRLFLWVYGHENNQAYLRMVRPLRKVTSKMSHGSLDMMAGMLAVLAGFYGKLCRFIRLPMSDYMLHYFSKLNFYSRKLVVYDQLNPTYSKYYRKEELKTLLEQSGFSDICFYHHLGYSWSLTARRK